jgi:hypothetical protein
MCACASIEGRERGVRDVIRGHGTGRGGKRNWHSCPSLHMLVPMLAACGMKACVYVCVCVQSTASMLVHVCMCVCTHNLRARVHVFL